MFVSVYKPQKKDRFVIGRMFLPTTIGGGMTPVDQLRHIPNKFEGGDRIECSEVIDVHIYVNIMYKCDAHHTP